MSELLRDNLYEFGRFIRENDQVPYFTIPRLKLITRQVLEALQFVHSLDLIHCDIKPENIVIKSFSRCEVKLIDFGSSCFTTDHLTTYIQSRSYRAPEVIIGHPYDGRIDLWSVGCVLAEMHTGYVLFQVVQAWHRGQATPTMLPPPYTTTSYFLHPLTLTLTQATPLLPLERLGGVDVV